MVICVAVVEIVDVCGRSVTSAEGSQLAECRQRKRCGWIFPGPKGLNCQGCFQMLKLGSSYAAPVATIATPAIIRQVGAEVV